MSEPLSVRDIKKSRKPHVCEWCGEAIPVGSAYLRECVAHYDGLSSSALHYECHGAILRFFEDKETRGEWVEYARDQPRGDYNDEVAWI